MDLVTEQRIARRGMILAAVRQLLVSQGYEAVTVRVPTTLLWGEQDKALLPSLLDGLERWVPQLDVQRVPEASHWIVHEQPGRVAELIDRLLA